MKNIFVAAIFLFSQLGFTAEKVKQTKPQKFQIENLTFSKLLLTKEEIIHLSEDDKKAYLISMIALGQILEGSQRFHMGYEDTVITTENKMNPKIISDKYAVIFSVLFPQAYAFWGLVLSRAAPLLARAGAWVATRAAPTVASGTQLAFEFGPSKKAMAEMLKLATENAKKLKDAQEALVKAMKNNLGSKVPLKEEDAVVKAREALRAQAEAFKAAGGDMKQFDKATSESGLKKIFMGVYRNKTNLVGGGLAAYGADNLLIENTGTSFEKLIEEVYDKSSTTVEHWLSGTDMSGPGIPTPEQMKALKAGDSSKAAGKTCLFGGVPSVWKDFADKGIKCTRPSESSNENCKREDGKFQCSNYGIKLASGAIDKDLCIETGKLDNLTVRCASTLKTVLETKSTMVDSVEVAAAVQQNFAQVIASLEARDRMKNEKGETKSIFEYCAADSVEQKDECGAIREVLGFLKSTDVVKIYESRVALAKATPAAPTAGTPEAGQGETKQ